jgi:uncharacterized protein with PhoU and TrkA domain
MEALYMTVITLTTVGYREVRELDTIGQLWTMGLLITGVGTLFYAAVSSVELAVEGAVRGYFERRRVRAKIEIVGADRTLSPYAVGGRRLASLATQPLIVDFLDIVTRGREGIEFRLEEFEVPKESPLANHTIGELQIGGKTGAMVLAIRTKEGKFDTTPSAQDRLLPGDTLIVLGTREQIGRLETLMASREPGNENP